MTKQEFLAELKENLEIESEFNFDTKLQELEEWDSMTAMVLIGYVSENFDTVLTSDDIESFNTVNDIIEKIGLDKFS
ncbi:acyl carrier protein [Chryseobacterium sp.]|uniref:acyl carrier protein n=1 Tax=Chryseobacterium sp. TaxID=1871047 RepID=UPI000ED32CDC|nr:acyl carrier protein [Chryseobacterium sp.]HCA07571.1 acyl carrier protein [Chryseobacterium sp.]